MFKFSKKGKLQFFNRYGEKSIKMNREALEILLFFLEHHITSMHFHQKDVTFRLRKTPLIEIYREKMGGTAQCSFPAFKAEELKNAVKEALNVHTTS